MTKTNCPCETRVIAFRDRDDTIKTAPVSITCAEHAPAARAARVEHAGKVRAAWLAMVRPMRLALPAPLRGAMPPCDESDLIAIGDAC